MMSLKDIAKYVNKGIEEFGNEMGVVLSGIGETLSKHPEHPMNSKYKIIKDEEDKDANI
jgi:hypothetical protein